MGARLPGHMCAGLTALDFPGHAAFLCQLRQVFPHFVDPWQLLPGPALVGTDCSNMYLVLGTPRYPVLPLTFLSKNILLFLPERQFGRIGISLMANLTVTT